MGALLGISWLLGVRYESLAECQPCFLCIRGASKPKAEDEIEELELSFLASLGRSGGLTGSPARRHVRTVRLEKVGGRVARIDGLRETVTIHFVIKCVIGNRAVSELLRFVSSCGVWVRFGWCG